MCESWSIKENVVLKQNTKNQGYYNQNCTEAVQIILFETLYAARKNMTIKNISSDRNLFF